MVPSPRVSVVIPSYQCDRYIAQAIQSVLSQTNCTYEILVIDDGSTDHTKDIVASCMLAQGESTQYTLRYTYQRNQGVCIARNRGIELSRGEFIAFLDADDYFLPNKLAAQVTAFDANPKLGLVQSGWQRVDETGQFIKNVQLWDSIPKLDLEAWLRFKPVLPSAMMFRRSWLERVGGFDPSYTVAEDVDLVLRLSLAGCAAEWLKQVTVSYRQHSTHAMGDGIAQARDVQRVIDKFFSQTILPEHIKLIERNVRYNTLIWTACYLYQTGYPTTMIDYLKRSYKLSPYLPTETVVHWIESLTEFSITHDISIDIYQITQSKDWQQLVQWVIHDNQHETSH